MAIKKSKKNSEINDVKRSCFAEKLKYLRENAGFTQEEFAKRLGLQQPAYARYENCVYFPRIDLMRKMANELNVSVEFLMYSGEIGFSYDDKNGYKFMTLTIPKDKLDVDVDEAIEDIQDCINTFKKEDLSLLYQCGTAIKMKNAIREIKKENNIEGERIDTIISDEPLEKIE